MTTTDPALPTSEDGGGDDEKHAPWHYTEYGVICACGAAMDRDERCTSLGWPPLRQTDAHSLIFAALPKASDEHDELWDAVADSMIDALEPVVALLLSQARADGERVRKRHVEETVMALRPGCGEDGDCDHEECPEDHPYQVCAGCREQLELAYEYIFEQPAAWREIMWPCATIRALDGIPS